MIEEAFDIGIQDPVASCPLIETASTFGSQAVLDRDGSILDGPAWAETEGVRLKDRFPFGFQGQFHQTLHNPIFQSWHTPSALPLRPKRLWDA